LQGLASSKSDKDHSSKSSKNASGSKSSKNGPIVSAVDAKADKYSNYSGKSLKSAEYHAAGSISMSVSERPFRTVSSKSGVVASKSGKSAKYSSQSMSYSLLPSSAPSESLSPSSSMHYVSDAKSGKAEVDAKAEKYNSEPSEHRYVSAKSEKTMQSSKSGKGAYGDSMSHFMSMPSSPPTKSTSPIDMQDIDTKAEKYSAKAYKLMQAKSDKVLVESQSSKSSKADVSMSFSMPSTAPSTSSFPTELNYDVVVVTTKSGKSQRELMSEKQAAEKVESTKSGKAEVATQAEEFSSKSSKSSSASGLTSMSYGYPSEQPSFMPSEAPSSTALPTHRDHKNAMISGKSSKSSSLATQVQVISSKSAKGSMDASSSKSSKSIGYYPESMSFSIAPSVAPSESFAPSTTTPEGFDAKAEKYSKSSKSSSSEYRNVSSKSNKVLSSKSGKSEDYFSDLSFSMSMPSSAPSESSRPTDNYVNTKAEKYSAKAYRLMKPKADKETTSSKSGKGSNAIDNLVGSVSMSYIMPLVAPSSSFAPSGLYDGHSNSSSKSSKSYQIDGNSMSYSMSLHQTSSESSKSGKAENIIEHVRGLKSERTAVEEVDW
jgi:hypothetical protein